VDKHRLSKDKSVLGELNPNWKGDKAGIAAIHLYVRKYLHRPQFCEDCKIRPPFDLANITGIYNREFKNWKYLCHKCHFRRDIFIDMSNRKCSNCGSTKTYIKKSTNRPEWHYDKRTKKLLCKKCEAYQYRWQE
jgi:hypothetical protein